MNLSALNGTCSIDKEGKEKLEAGKKVFIEKDEWQLLVD